MIGVVREAADCFEQNKHERAEQCSGCAGRWNISDGADQKQLFLDDPRFFTYIDTRTEDPYLSMQMTVGSSSLALDAARLAPSHILAVGGWVNAR